MLNNTNKSLEDHIERINIELRKEGYKNGTWLSFDVYTGAEQIKIRCARYPYDTVVNDDIDSLSRRHNLPTITKPILGNMDSKGIRPRSFQVIHHEIYHIPGTYECFIILYYTIVDETENADDAKLKRIDEDERMVILDDMEDVCRHRKSCSSCFFRVDPVYKWFVSRGFR